MERREAPPPLVEESLPSGLSGPYAHAPCWLKVSLSSKLVWCAPQLPPRLCPAQNLAKVGFFFLTKKKKWKVLRMGLPIMENLSGLQESIFNLFRSPQLHSDKKNKHSRIVLNLAIVIFSPVWGPEGKPPERHTLVLKRVHFW